MDLTKLMQPYSREMPKFWFEFFQRDFYLFLRPSGWMLGMSGNCQGIIYYILLATLYISPPWNHTQKPTHTTKIWKIINALAVAKQVTRTIPEIRIYSKYFMYLLYSYTLGAVVILFLLLFSLLPSEGAMSRRTFRASHLKRIHHLFPNENR